MNKFLAKSSGVDENLSLMAARENKLPQSWADGIDFPVFGMAEVLLMNGAYAEMTHSHWQDLTTSDASPSHPSGLSILARFFLGKC